MTHLSASEERRNGRLRACSPEHPRSARSQRGNYYKELLRSQQGELNAVLMYQRLARVVIADFPEVGSVKNDEKRHGDIFSGILDT